MANKLAGEVIRTFWSSDNVYSRRTMHNSTESHLVTELSTELAFRSQIVFPRSTLKAFTIKCDNKYDCRIFFIAVIVMFENIIAVIVILGKRAWAIV